MCAELVDAAQRRIVLAGDQPRADAPDVDGRALGLEVPDDLLVEVARGGDLRVREAGLIEHFARLAAEEGEVAAVKADAHRLVALLAQLAEHGDGVGHAAAQRVVGIHQ